jgi:hypothetical protein
VGQHGEVRGNLARTGLGEGDELGLRHVAPSRHSMTGFQYLPTAAKAISRPGLSPSSNQPAARRRRPAREAGERPYRTIPPAGSGPHIDTVNSGVPTASKSRLRAA